MIVKREVLILAIGFQGVDSIGAIDFQVVVAFKRPKSEDGK